MKPSVQKIVAKLANQKVELLEITQAKNILKEFDKIADINDDIQRKLKASVDKMERSDEDYRDKTRKLDKEILALKDKRIQIFDENKSEKQSIAKSMTKLIAELENEANKTAKNVAKGENILKEFKNELNELGINPSSSRLYEELSASISITKSILQRIEMGLKQVKSNGYYLQYK